MHRLFGLALITAVSTAAFVQSRSAKAADPIKIGIPLPLTGSLAEAGSKQDRGYEMCREAVNAKGGIKVGSTHRRLEFVKYDYQSETNRAIQVTQRLITVDNVSFLFSPYGSGDTKASAAVAERYGIPMVASGAAAESIFDQGFKNIFGVLFPSRFISRAEIKFYSERLPSLKRIAVLSMNSLYPKSIAADIVREAEAAKLSVVYQGSFTPDTLDFSTVLTQIKESQPDWIYITGYTQSNVQIRRQMAEQGVSAPIVTMTLGPAYPEFVQNLGSVANGVTTATWFHSNASYTDNFLFGSTKAYAEAFFDKHGYLPADVDAAATATCEVLVEAIELAGAVDAGAIRKIFSEKRFDTFYGAIKFGATGQNSVDRPILLQILDGKSVILSPSDMREAEPTLRK